MKRSPLLGLAATAMVVGLSSGTFAAVATPALKGAVGGETAVAKK